MGHSTPPNWFHNSRDTDMICYLERYDHTKVEVNIPDGTKEIAGVYVSGDEILIYPCYCDPCAHSRVADMYDGCFCRVWNGVGWVEKEDYPEIEIEED